MTVTSDEFLKEFELHQATPCKVILGKLICSIFIPSRLLHGVLVRLTGVPLRGLDLRLLSSFDLSPQ